MIRVRTKRQPLKHAGDEQQMFTNRATIGFIAVSVLFVLLASRYFWLQVSHYEDFEVRSDSNRVRVVSVPPSRGLIYDRRGRLVAVNRPAWRLELTPERVENLDTTWGELSALVALDPEDRERFERIRNRYRAFDLVPVKSNLSEAEVARLAVNQHRLPGVTVSPYLARHYPYGELLTHVLGYVGRMDEDDLARVDAGNYRGTTHIGKSGVEYANEQRLHGQSGVERVETNVTGRVLRVLERTDPVPGTDLVLSLDVVVQQAAWDALGDRAGSVVAIDPRDGSIVALVSKPAYDPNLFVHGISNTDYQAILNAPQRPLFNRALSGSYEPGSTLKPFVGLAGLELGVVQPSTRVFSNGEFYLPGRDRPYRDWRRGGHGWVEIAAAIEQSVNTYFYQLALDLGIDRMHDYLAQFGFGARTGVDLPNEGVGLLPSRAWKRGQFNQPWYPGETVIAGIGQGFNVTTPLQLANATATLVNNGRRVAPRVVFAHKAENQQRAEREQAPFVAQVPVRSTEHWELVREGMRRVVHGVQGTARAIAAGRDWQMAGKSGTAQVFGLAENQQYREDEVPEHLRNHALFIAFAPFEQPSLAVAVVVDHGGGGSTMAAPVAASVLDAWLGQEFEP